MIENSIVLTQLLLDLCSNKPARRYIEMCVCEFKFTSIIKLPKSGPIQINGNRRRILPKKPTNRNLFYIIAIFTSSPSNILLVIYLFLFSEAMVFISCVLCSPNLQGTLQGIGLQRQLIASAKTTEYGRIVMFRLFSVYKELSQCHYRF